MRKNYLIALFVFFLYRNALKRCFLFAILAILFTFNGFSQKDSIYVYQNGSILFKEAVNKFDSITFVENISKNALHILFQNEIIFNRNVSEIDSVNFGSNMKALPLVATGNISEISKNQAICEGTVLNDGGSNLIACGFCWSTAPDPTIADSTTNEGNTVGAFISTISNLNSGTTYYIRAYATNKIGTVYGEQISFTTESALTGKNWMGGIGDATSLCSISIPGTHDSGATSGISLAKCQDWSITTQLNNGIRFFDMRFKVSGERLRVYHGIVPMDLYHDVFFNTIRQFLTDNPTETVIISIRNEDDGASTADKTKFRQILDDEMGTNENQWFTASSIPKLSEVRGKMILFRRYDGNKGINMFNGWSDNATFNISGGKVQDVYSISGTSDNSINSKWEAISALLNEASKDEGSRFFVNFCSASAGGFTTPKSVADKVNPKLQSFMDTAAKGSWGWILMDFPTEKLVSDIYMKNIQ